MAASTLPLPLAAGLFGGALASVCTFFGWVAHFPHATTGQLILRVPATLILGTPLYAAAGFLFSRWLVKPPPIVGEIRGFGRAPILLAFGIVCGGLRWAVTACGSLFHVLQGDPAPIGIFNLFLLLPQVVFSALLATAAFAYPAFRLERSVTPTDRRIQTVLLAGWGLGAWLVAFLATLVFESGAGTLVSSHVTP
ncbi:MAG TPA: hypothetical protein VFI25_10190 [Planctomycetota bacterium]|nr:hypothetical protein [Planctomycetota bacterium]